MSAAAAEPPIIPSQLTPEGEAFVAMLRTLRGGAVVNELAARLGAVVDGVFDMAVPGSVTLKLAVKPIKGDASKVVIVDEIPAKVPEDRSDVLYVGKGSTLTHLDPRHGGTSILRTGDGLFLGIRPDPDDRDDRPHRGRRDLDE